MIRPATKDDLVAVFQLGQAMYAETRTAFPEPDMEWFGRFFDFAVTQPGSAMFLIAEEEEAIGFLLGWIVPSCYSPQRQASAELLYVKPERRSLKTARALVSEFERRAAEQGAVTTMLSASTGIDIGPLAKRLGYVHHGVSYRKDVR